MKRFAAALLLSTLIPLSAAAQDAPPPGDAPPPPPAHAGWHHGPDAAQRAQFEQLHHKTRARILGILTSAQRTLLADVVSSLAVAEVPDFKGAAQRLDSTLSTGQQQSILAAVKDEHTEMRAMFHHGNFSPPPGKPHTSNMMHKHGPPDAGEVLLRTALDFGGRGPMGEDHRMDGPPPGGPPPAP